VTAQLDVPYSEAVSPPCIPTLPVIIIDAEANSEPVNSITSAFVDIIVCPLGPIKLVEPETVREPVI
jgi:hypothetical protein